MQTGVRETEVVISETQEEVEVRETRAAAARYTGAGRGERHRSTQKRETQEQVEVRDTGADRSERHRGRQM